MEQNVDGIKRRATRACRLLQPGVFFGRERVSLWREPRAHLGDFHTDRHYRSDPPGYEVKQLLRSVSAAVKSTGA